MGEDQRGKEGEMLPYPVPQVGPHLGFLRLPDQPALEQHAEDLVAQLLPQQGWFAGVEEEGVGDAHEQLQKYFPCLGGERGAKDARDHLEDVEDVGAQLGVFVHDAIGPVLEQLGILLQHDLQKELELFRHERGPFF